MSPAYRPALAGLLGLAALVALGELCLGALDLTPAAALRALVAGPAAADSGAWLLWRLRLPRLLLAAMAGATLAAAGAALQALFRNPLAEPGLAGVSGGSALAVAALLASPLAAIAPPALVPVLLPAAAFIGALAAALLVLRAARSDNRTATADLLLAGIAVNAIAGAGIAWLCLRADSAALRNYLAWTYGDLGRADWPALAVAAPLFALALLLPLRDARKLDALLLGESAAAHLGIAVEPLKRRLLLCAVLGAAATAATAGPIGFVGLIAPHLARQFGGGLHRRLLPLAALTGAVLLSAADLIGRRVALPAEVPAGVLTALLGAPFFLTLLLSGRRAARLP